MNALAPAAVPVALIIPPVSPFRRARRPAPRRQAAFALVVALLILSLLIVVAVSFLSSSTSERQTSDAYTAKARAEQAAQAAVDSATAMLSQSFRDFPDSATVWDPQQSANTGAPTGRESQSTVTGTFNEGTTLYLHAVSKMASANGTPVTVADAQYTGTTTVANDPNGNNPNNPACKTFVLPLISGVAGGYAQLASEVRAAGGGARACLPAFNLTEMDPAKQTDPTKTYCTDLNVRRFQGDTRGVIGSPPDWDTGTNKPAGPKPARALWVNLKGSDGLVTGRYAFWMEDEGFRVNVNTAGNATTRIDNSPDAATKKYPLDPTTKQPYIAGPSVASLSGLLTTFSSSPASDAQRIIDTRSLYPVSFFPDPLAFKHAYDGESADTTKLIEGLRYLTTTQSGTLNLTRHGTQRLNLNTTVATVAPSATTAIQKQIDQIVQALKFHLPKFGQRFYRTTNATDAATLNNSTMVGPTSALAARQIGDPSLIYLYKVAANIRDYIDTDSQPTLIQAGGSVQPAGMASPVHPFGEDGQANPIWAIGKEAAPFLQETAIRFQPVIPQDAPNKGTYTLAIDYYLEFWNMTDRDIYAAPQSDPTKASLNGAKIAVTYQQNWRGYKSTALLTSNIGPAPVSRTNDFVIDLTKGANTAGEPVVFRAGTATVITTDPDYQTYRFATPIHSSTKYKTLTDVPNPKTTFYCQIVPPGTRTYAGKLLDGDYGIYPEFRDGTQDYQTEVTFYNDSGYFDCASFGIAEGGSPVQTYTDSYKGDGDYNNYSYGGSLYGNTLASEMGDPRTNNEQMFFSRTTGAAGDLSRYYNGNHTLGYPNANYVQPSGGSTSPVGSSSSFLAWPDYYSWADNTGYANPTMATAPAVVADGPLASINQLGDVYDPARSVTSVVEMSRGGGRTFKIGQRDDRVTYDPAGSPFTTPDSVPASLGWASWRLTDVFSAGPVDLTNPTGPVQEPVELPARLNINGVLRDKGAALRTLLTGFNFQPATADPSVTTTEPLFHTPPSMAGTPLSVVPNDTTGLANVITQIMTRLGNSSPSGSNLPWGPFFERGELGELETASGAIFGKNGGSPFAPKLLPNVDLSKTFDRGREELCRRLSEMICTRGDTFTVYVVGQSITQPNAQAAFKVNGTHRMRVTFRLVPKIQDPSTPGVYHDFHPAYDTKADGDPTIVKARDYDPTAVSTRFSKPDRYDVQVLNVTTL